MRPKDYVVSDATRVRISVGKERARKEQFLIEQALQSKEKTVKKPVIVLTGREVDAYDFFHPLRSSLYSQKMYSLCQKLERSITKNEVWQNVPLIKEILSLYCTLITRPGTTKSEAKTRTKPKGSSTYKKNTSASKKGAVMRIIPGKSVQRTKAEQEAINLRMAQVREAKRLKHQGATAPSS